MVLKMGYLTQDVLNGLSAVDRAVGVNYLTKKMKKNVVNF